MLLPPVVSLTAACQSGSRPLSGVQSRSQLQSCSQVDRLLLVTCMVRSSGAMLQAPAVHITAACRTGSRTVYGLQSRSQRQRRSQLQIRSQLQSRSQLTRHLSASCPVGL